MPRFVLLLVLAALLAVASTFATAAQVPARSNANLDIKWKDSTACAVCVFALTEVEKQIKEHSQDIGKLLAQTCKLIDNAPLQKLCTDLVSKFGSKFIEHLVKKETPDWICSKVGLCGQCHLFASGNDANAKQLRDMYFGMSREQRMKLKLKTEDERVQASQVMGRMISGIVDGQLEARYFDQVAAAAVGAALKGPTVDSDHDLHSPRFDVPRGANWHGRDCDDSQSVVRPGTRQGAIDLPDTNCNGIKGKDATTGKNLEFDLCQSLGNEDRTLVVLGDSASAGFSIPVQWLDLKDLKDLIPSIVNELDHPYQAWGTGWDEKLTAGRSIYGKLRERNLCMHRQFYSVAKNGAEMANLTAQVAQLPIDSRSKPVFATIGYIGNDICAPKLDMMTTPAAFRASLLSGLNALNAKVAKGSKVVLVGLVDGRILFDHMHNRTHPLSPPGVNITYEQFYSFLSCVGVNPCNTWLTSDAATRNAATARALELDDQIEDVVKNVKFSNLDLAFIDFEKILEEGFELLEKHGIEAYRLIDPVDGFHPSLDVGHRVIADVIFEHLSAEHPDFVGAVNPNNARIKQLFGDQGGY